MWSKPPPENPQLAQLRRAERELIEKRVALEAELLETPDPRDSNQILREIDDLNAQIGVTRDQIKELE